MDPLRLLILGAHPDDAEYHAGGLATAYRRLGHAVKMVSCTDGSAGHQSNDRATMAPLRRREAAAAGGVIGAEYVTWNFPDGLLQPSFDLRHAVLREIRTFQPDLVLTHRTNDYHPDHRAVGQAVQDASYLVTVPRIAPEAPALRRDPVVASMIDLFTRPCPLRPDAILDATGDLDSIVAMMDCHASQFYDWLPYNEQISDQVPQDKTARKAWLREWFLGKAAPRCERFRPELTAAIGAAAAAQVRVVEAYEISEYAGRTDEAHLRRLFPGAILPGRG